MPLYEYECTTCHRLTEKIQKFSDPELTTCPFCSGPLVRTINAPAVSFKGGGWYADLYSSSKKPSSGESSSNSSSSSSSSSTSSTSTPAASSSESSSTK
ncbi:MAG TPA: FmdB family zinc ribbon protein [Granulicella sp.]